jgi:hypothetical protein
MYPSSVRDGINAVFGKSVNLRGLAFADPLQEAIASINSDNSAFPDCSFTLRRTAALVPT